MHIELDNPGNSAPDIVTVFVEIPKGSHNKYELDKQTGLIALNRVLSSAVRYPGDYGMIPGTLAEDGDPLDILVITDEPTFPGCIIHARPIGILRLIDTGKGDHKVIAVPMNDKIYRDVDDIDHIPEYRLEEFAHFFTVYKLLEKRAVKVKGWQGAKEAKNEIVSSIARYKKGIKSKGTRNAHK